MSDYYDDMGDYAAAGERYTDDLWLKACAQSGALGVVCMRFGVSDDEARKQVRMAEARLRTLLHVKDGLPEWIDRASLEDAPETKVES